MQHISYIIELHVDKSIRRHYKLTANGYRQLTSFNAFFSGKKKIARDRKRGVLWVNHTEESHKIEMETAREFATVKVPVWDRLPIIEYGSIWDFYAGIGYDYKKQRFLTEVTK